MENYTTSGLCLPEYVLMERWFDQRPNGLGKNFCMR